MNNDALSPDQDYRLVRLRYLRTAFGKLWNINNPMNKQIPPAYSLQQKCVWLVTVSLKGFSCTMQKETSQYKRNKELIKGGMLWIQDEDPSNLMKNEFQ